MSTRFIVAAAAAAVYGFFTWDAYGAATVFAVVYGATGFLDPAIKNMGPRLEDLRGVKANYGDPFPVVFGHPRVAGVIAWSSQKYEVATETSEGKGGPDIDSTTFTYKIDLLIVLCEQPGYIVRRSWANGKLHYSIADVADGETLEASQNTDQWDEIRNYRGEPTQMPDPTYEAAIGAGLTPANRGRSTVMLVGVNCGTSGYPPQFTFEISNGDITSSSTLLLDAPLIEDDDDDVTVPDSASVVVTGDVTFDAGRAMFSSAPGDPASLAYSKASMFASITDNPTLPVSVSAIIEVESSYGSGTADGAYFLMTGDLPRAAYFTVRMVGGELQLGVFAYLDPSSYEQVIGPLGSGEHEYRITIRPDGYEVFWYVDDVKVAQSGFGLKTPTTVFLGSSASPAGGGIEVMRARSLLVYMGSEPRSVSQVGLVDHPLDAVVSELCLRSGLTVDDIDVTELIGKSVRSLGIGQISAPRATIDILAEIFFFDPVDTGDKIAFKMRGGSAAATIPYRELGASVNIEPSEPLPMQSSSEIEVAAQIVVTYANVLNDYQDGSERSDRLATESSVVKALQLPIGLTPTEAKRIAERHIQNVATGLMRVGPIAVSRKYAALLPADPVNVVDKYNRTHRLRFMRRVDGAGGMLTFDAVFDDADAIISTAETNTDYTSSETVRRATKAELQIWDIPILRDADDFLGQYAAMKWERGSSATLYEDGLPIGTVTRRATMGRATTALDDWAGGNVLDQVSSVTVDVGEGELESYTIEQVLAGTVPGYAIGSELVFATTATQIDVGIYTLTGFLRGQRGTEWAVGTHAVGDPVLRLTNDGILKIEHEPADLNVEHTFHAVTSGLRLADADEVRATDTGVAKKPFSPVNVVASRDAGGIIVNWDRRTRLAQNWLAGSVPLGEQTEAYEIDFANAGTDVLYRTLTSATDSVAYSPADQTADGVTSATLVRGTVYQMSATVGRGYGASVETMGGYDTVAAEAEIEVGGTFAEGRLLYAFLNGVQAQHVTDAGDINLAGAATSLAAAIDALAGFSASAVGTTITVEADEGGPLSLSAGVNEPSLLTDPVTTQIASGVSAGLPEVWRVDLAVVGGMMPPGTYRLLFTNTLIGQFVAQFSTTAWFSPFTILAGLCADANAGPPGTTYGITSTNYGTYARIEFPLGATGWSASGSTVWTTAFADVRWSSEQTQAAYPVVYTPQPQISYVGVNGLPVVGDTYHVTINATTYNHTSTGASAAAEAAAIAAIVNADADVVAVDVSGTTPPGVPGAGGLIRITGVADAVPFTISTSTDTTITLTVTVINPGA